MKVRLARIRSFYKSSKFAPPITLFFLLIVVSSIFVFLVEIKKNDQFKTVFDGLWWAIITFSTTGYGDKVPITIAGRILTTITIFIGISAMSFLSGTLASVFVDRNTKARRGLMDLSTMKKHYIICGWKDNMRDILSDMIRFSGFISSDDIVIISNVDSDKIEELKESKELRELHFVRGDYFSESVLKRASVQSAEKVIILADALESKAPSEVDSKTVMTVLTVKALSKDVYVCAELLDKKYEAYLKQSMCDEIIYVRDFTRYMLANTTANSGISHILFELVSRETNTYKLITIEVPPEFVNGKYCTYKATFEKSDNRLLLGILENTGSANRMKIEALREAQKTSDVSHLISNLQKVKTMEINKPVLLPDNDYIIPNYSRAIVLER